MTINITVEFDHGNSSPENARQYELYIAQWLRRIIATNCIFKKPDIHVDLVDTPCPESPPTESKSPDGAPSS